MSIAPSLFLIGGIVVLMMTCIGAALRNDVKEIREIVFKLSFSLLLAAAVAKYLGW